MAEFDWAGLVAQFFELCLFPFLALLGVYVCKWLDSSREKVKAETDNETYKKYVDMVAETVKDCVIATNQTYVQALKEKGEFDLEAQKAAFQETYDAIMAILSDEAKVYLATAFGDVQVYITKEIEKEVKLNK